MSSQKFLVQDFSDWKSVIDFLKPFIRPKTVFLLSGDLGSGKTTLVSQIAEQLQVPLVTSPTFALIQNYHSPMIKISHVDLYRLEGTDEIEATGFWELFEQTDSVVFVEWPSKIPHEHWPMDWCKIQIQILKNENERHVEIFS